MGAKRFMAKIVTSIARHYGASDKKEVEEILYNTIKPRQANGGFMELFMMVACPCGEPCLIKTTPPDDMEEKIKEAIDSGEIGPDEIKCIEARSVHYKDDDTDKSVPCTNMGMTTTTCDECGATFIACWEFEACQVEPDTKFPWDEGEGLSHPASGPSFSPPDKRTSETVH